MSRRNAGQRRIHLTAPHPTEPNTILVLGACDLPFAASISSDENAEGLICQRCQRALEKLVRVTTR